MINKLIRRQLQFSLDNYKDYHSFVEEHIITQLRDLDQSMERANEEDYDTVDELSYEHSTIKNKFAPQFRNSLIIQLYSFIEDSLKSFCNDFERQSIFSVNDLRGQSDLEKCKLFITKTKVIEFSKLSPEWGFIDNLRKVRNCLVHHKGIITDEDMNFKSVDTFKMDKYSLELIGPKMQFEDNQVIELKTKIYSIILDDPAFITIIKTTCESLFDKLYLS